MFPAALDGNAGLLAFSIADKQVFVAFVERHDLVVPGALVRVDDKENGVQQIVWQGPRPFHVMVDGLRHFMVAGGIDDP